jgi:hypothetical protein
MEIPLLHSRLEGFLKWLSKLEKPGKTSAILPWRITEVAHFD